MLILGIETSCDETGAALIEATDKNKKVKLISNKLASSLNLHKKTGGIIPEIAAREQVKYIIPVINRAIEQCNNLTIDDVDAIAVTIGPGLIGSLLVGVETARTFSYIWKKPIIPVNHLIGHIYANFISEIHNSEFIIHNSAADVQFPTIALIVSGGHTDLVLINNHGSIKWLGGTRDDAAGEAFDKIGRLLGLPYPVGPSIEKEAAKGDPKKFNFPRPLMYNRDFSAKGGPASGWDFSFSGLKTAVFREISRYKDIKILSEQTIADISASLQEAIVDVLVYKTLKAAQRYKVKSILLGGGVAANSKLREQFELKIENLELKIPFFVPEKRLCTDNAAMIATAAFYNYKPIPWKKITANPELYFY